MAKRALVNGKVMRTPSLSAYDNRRPRAGDLHAPDQVVPDFKSALAFEKDYPSTRARDKALLVSLGVNGEVPFVTAASNAGLPTIGQEGGVRFANKDGLWRLRRAANDNHEQAAVAA